MEVGEEAAAGRGEMEAGGLRRKGKEEVSKVFLAYTYDTQINATQYAEEIWFEQVKQIPKKNAEGLDESRGEVEAIRRGAEERRSVTESVREKADQLRIKVLKWRDERPKAIERTKKWRKEIGDSSDDGNSNAYSSNANTEKTKENQSIQDVRTERESASSDRMQEERREVTKGVECQKNLQAEKMFAKDRKEDLMHVSGNKEPKECRVVNCVQKGEEREIEQRSAVEISEEEDVAGVVHIKEKFMVENEWSAREVIEKSILKFNSRKEVKECVAKSDSRSVAKENADRVGKGPKMEKSAPRRMRKKTPLTRSKSEPVEGFLEDNQSASKRQELLPNIVQEGWKEVVERVKRQRQEQAILDEKKLKADEIKAETQKKEEKLRKDLEEARLAEEREKEERRAAELAEAEAEEQRWVEEEKKRKEQQRKWQEAMDRIDLQVVEESIKEQEREGERMAKEKEEAKEPARELNEIQREIEERVEMVEEYWKAKEQDEEELNRVLAEEEEWWSGSGREEEQRRVKEMEEKRQAAIKRELDKQEEEVKRAKEEVLEKQRWAAAQVEQMRRIEIERERALERVLMSRPTNEVNQETLSDRVHRRVMKRHAEKEKEDEEKRRLEERKKESTLRQSIFPNMPIYINFVAANSLPDIVGRNMSEGLKNMGWYVWAPRGKNAVPDKSQNEGWTIQSKYYFLKFPLGAPPPPDCTEYNGFQISWVQYRYINISLLHYLPKQIKHLLFAA